MNWFYNLKIGQKILTGFILVTVITALVGYTDLGTIKSIQGNSRSMYELNTVPMGYIYQLDSAYQKMRLSYREILLDDNKDTRQKHLMEVDRYQEQITDNLDKLEKTSKSQAFLKECENLRNAFNSFEPIKQRIIQLALANKGKEAAALLKEPASIAAVEKIEDSIDKMAQIKIENAKQKSDNDLKTAQAADTFMLIVLLGAIVFALAMGFFISRLISRPLNRMTYVAQKISQRDVVDLDLIQESKSHDETGMLAKELQQIIDSIHDYQDLAIKIANGDPNIDFAVKSEKDMVGKNFNIMAQALKDLLAEMEMMVQAALEGKLETRGNEDKFQGGYRTLVHGVNQTLDAVIKPIQEAAAVLQEMQQGNLAVAAEGNYQGDYAVIKNALNNTIGTINQVLGEIHMAAEQVASGSRQVSVSSQSLSQGSTEQATSLEEISASITQMATQTKQNAHDASQGSQLAMAVKENASKGNGQMKEMLESMSQINEASANISKIIKVIDEIAFQTNILSLNAAVEAARAGQHGKGFAVVAEEVRNLAARSANAAKETTLLIEGSVEKVQAGTRIANETADALNSIVDQVSQMAELVEEIAQASNEQANGIAQVNQALNQVDKVVQMNTATAEESAAASEELSGQAELLKDMVGRFTLKNVKASFSKSSAASQFGKLEKEAPNMQIMLDDQDFGKY